MRSQTGNAMITALMMVSVLSIIGLSLTSLSGQFSQYRLGNNLHAGLALAAHNLRVHLENEAAWQSSVADNGNAVLQCERSASSCAGATGNIRVSGADGVLYYDPLTLPQAGFDQGGRVCNEFRPTGNLACPIRADITWTAICSGACADRQIRLDVSFSMGNSPENRGVNFKRYNFTIFRP